MANLRMGMVYDIQGKRDLALEQYRKVLWDSEYKESAHSRRNSISKPYAALTRNQA